MRCASIRPARTGAFRHGGWTDCPASNTKSSASRPVAGVDEAGRGPLAGPVVAAAVILPAKGVPRGIDDSKKLSAAERAPAARPAARLRDRRRRHRRDRRDRHAQHLLGDDEGDDAGGRALARCSAAIPAMCWSTATACRAGRYPATAIVGGDAISLSIAAASIVAKHTRDTDHDRARRIAIRITAGIRTRAMAARAPARAARTRPVRRCTAAASRRSRSLSRFEWRFCRFEFFAPHHHGLSLWITRDSTSGQRPEMFRFVNDLVTGIVN